MLRLEYLDWLVHGKHCPPPKVVKYGIIKSLLVKQKTNVIVETGTYLGDFIAYVLDSVTEIYSIEVSHDLYTRAKDRFLGVEKVHLMQGDSVEVMPSILDMIRASCLFWLDAHWSGGITTGNETKSPIIGELNVVLNHSLRNGLDHLIVVDDAREFTGKRGFPTIPEVERVVKNIMPDWVVRVRSDMIYIGSIDLLH